MHRPLLAHLSALGTCSALGLVAACGGSQFSSSAAGGAAGVVGSSGDAGVVGSSGDAALAGADNSSGGLSTSTGGSTVMSNGGSGAVGAGGVTGGTGGTGGGATGGTGSGGVGGVVGSGGVGGVVGSGGMGVAGGGGSGGSPACPDADGDGQTTCKGDCDDSDPNNFAGNKELCGDAKDNNCNQQADETCMGLGTFVSGATGNNANPGTQKLPVQTIGQGMLNAAKLGGGLAVYVAGAHYPEKITMVEGINLLGGYACNANACTWTRDPTANDTAILATDNAGVVIPATVTRATKIDGFRIMGQDGAGQGRGRSALTITGGTAVVSNNHIFGPATSSGGGSLQGRSVAVLIQAPSNAKQGVLLDSNQITGGAAADASIAVLLENVNAALVQAAADVRNNTIRGGTSSTLGAGVAAYSAGAGTSLSHNDIWSGTATSANGNAWAVIVADHVDLEGNLINVGNAGTKCPANDVRWCGGIYSLSGTMTITNNVIFGVAAQMSTAVDLSELEKASGTIALNSNLLDGAGAAASSSGPAGPMSAALVVEIGSCSTCGFNGKVGRARNNILRGGVGASRFGVYESAPAGKTQHPEALTNNAFFIPTPLGAGDALYRYFDGSTQSLFSTAAQINALPMLVPALPVASNLAVDPQIDGAFHLPLTSPCIDTGTATEAPMSDREGNPRPMRQGYDIGPSEVK